LAAFLVRSMPAAMQAWIAVGQVGGKDMLAEGGLSTACHCFLQAVVRVFVVFRKPARVFIRPTSAPAPGCCCDVCHAPIPI